MTRPDIKEELRGKEAAILSALGIKWRPGSRTHIRCPFPHHDDKNPSWRWDDSRSRYFCTCSGGSIIDIVLKMRGGNFVEAARWCREVLGIERRHPSHRTRDTRAVIRIPVEALPPELRKLSDAEFNDVMIALFAEMLLRPR